MLHYIHCIRKAVHFSIAEEVVGDLAMKLQGNSYGPLFLKYHHILRNLWMFSLPCGDESCGETDQTVWYIFDKPLFILLIICILIQYAVPIT